VLTGETGAGKTVLAHALDLLLGGRPRSGIVRPGASEAYVEGCFGVPEALREQLAERLPEGSRTDGRDAEDCAELVLARRVGSDGRTRAYVNGRAAGVADLRDLGGALVAFFGQHEHRALTLSAAQLEILDGQCGQRHARRLRDCGAAFARVRELERRVEQLEELSAARGRELDLLEHELAEIEAREGDLDRYEQLLAARRRLRTLDALLAGAGEAAERLDADGCASALAAEAAAGLEALAGVDDALDALAERVRVLTLESREIASELRDLCERAQAEAQDGAGDERLDAGADALEALEERLAAVERLTRKHGGSVETVREHALASAARREELAHADSAATEARTELGEAREALEKLARELTEARQAAAGPFSAAVRKQLGPLAMPGASFEVAFAEREIGPAGADAVEFRIAPNRGVPAGPLREIASGGELSRVMLAIMSVAAERGAEATLVFDEVDAGIGGQTAKAVGARLRALARDRQIVCITHLPQIASLASRHFSIVKDGRASTALASVHQLDEGEVLSELVRMLGADGDDAGARRHARELLRAA